MRFFHNFVFLNLIDLCPTKRKRVFILQLRKFIRTKKKIMIVLDLQRRKLIFFYFFFGVGEERERRNNPNQTTCSFTPSFFFYGDTAFFFFFLRFVARHDTTFLRFPFQICNFGFIGFLLSFQSSMRFLCCSLGCLLLSLHTQTHTNTQTHEVGKKKNNNKEENINGESGK